MPPFSAAPSAAAVYICEKKGGVNYEILKALMRLKIRLHTRT